MDSTEKSRQFWHETAARAMRVATSARTVIDHPHSELLAIRNVQALLDQFWRMGFWPTGEAIDKAEPQRLE